MKFNKRKAETQLNQQPAKRRRIVPSLVKTRLAYHACSVHHTDKMSDKMSLATQDGLLIQIPKGFICTCWRDVVNAWHQLNHGGSIVAKQSDGTLQFCLLYTSPSPRDQRGTRMPSSA